MFETFISKMVLLLVAFVILLGSNMAFKLEPSSCSSFHYEEQTLEKMIRLQIFVEKMKEEVDATQLKVQTDILEMKSLLEAIKSDTEDDLVTTKLQQSVKQLADDVTEVKESTAKEPVAFHSHEVGDMAMADNKVIVFTTIMINYNDAYNNRTGVFTVPLDGVYLFTVQLSSHAPQGAYYGIYVNEAFVLHGYVGEKIYKTAHTLTAVADVTKNDRVTVRCIANCGGDRLYEHIHSSSSFSGVLVQAK